MVVYDAGKRGFTPWDGEGFPIFKTTLFDGPHHSRLQNTIMGHRVSRAGWISAFWDGLVSPFYWREMGAEVRSSPDNVLLDRHGTQFQKHRIFRFLQVQSSSSRSI